MKNIKSEILIQFIEKGLPEIKAQIESIKKELTDLEQVSKKISISKNIVTDLQKVKNTIQLLNKELSLISKSKFEFTDFKQIETQLNILISNISKVKRVTIEVNRLKSTIIQTKNALLQLNRVKLTGLESEFKKLNIQKNLDKLKTKNNIKSPLEDLFSVNGSISQQEKMLENIDKLKTEFYTIFNELTRGNKKKLSKIIDLNKLKEAEDTFKSLKNEAITTHNLAPLKNYVKEFKTLSMNWSSAVRGNLKHTKELQNLFKSLSQEENTLSAKFAKNSITSTKQLIDYTQTLINKTKKAKTEFEQYFNKKQNKAALEDITQAEKIIEEYTTKIKAFENLQNNIINKASSGVTLSHQELTNYANSIEKTIKNLDTLNHKVNNVKTNLNDTYNKAIQQEKVAKKVSQLKEEFYASFNEITKGNKKELSKIIDLDKLKETEKVFKSLQEEATSSLNTSQLENYVKKFQTLSSVWSSTVRGNLKHTEELQKLFQSLSQKENIASAKFTKDTITSTKQLIDYTQTLIKQTEKANANLKQHLNVRKAWAKTSDIKQAEKVIDEYTTKIKILEELQKTLVRRASSGRALSHQELANYAKSIEKVAKGVDILDKKIFEVKSKLNESSGLKYFLQSARTAFTYASLYGSIYEVFQVIHNSVAYVVEFNNATKQLQAVLNLTGNEANTLETRIAHLGTIYGGTIAEINKASLALARAGVSTDKIAKSTEIVIKMAKLTGDSFETSANALITFMTVYKDSGVSIQQLGDELAYVANQSKLSTDDINTFANYALQTTKAVGITRHYVEAMAIAFSNAGTRAETIGTAIRRLGTLATDNATAVQGFFRKIGISQQTFAYLLTRSSEDSARVMTELTKKLASLSDEEFSKATANMEILAKQSLTLLRQNANEIINQYQKLSQGVSGELNQANIVTESYLGTWEKLRNTFGEVFNSLSQQLFPVMEKVGYSLINTLQTVEVYMPQILEYFSKLKKIIEEIAIAIGSAFAIKGIMKVSSGLSELIIKGNLVKGVIEGIGVALGALSKNPIGLLLSALTVAGVELYNQLAKVQTMKGYDNSLQEDLTKQIELRKKLVKYDTLMATYKRLQKKLQYDIVNGNQAEIQKDKDQLATIITQLRATKQIIDKQQFSLSIEEKKKKLIKEYTKYLTASLKLRDLQNKANKTEADKKAIEKLEAFIKPYKKVLGSFKEFSKVYEKIQNQTNKQIGNQKVLFTITNALITKYSQLKTVITSLDKQGVNVTNSIKLYHQNLLKTLSDGIKGFKVLTKNTFKDIFSTQPIKETGIAKQINSLLGKIDKAKTVQDITDIQNAILKLQLSIQNVANEKDRKNLETFVSVLKENLSNIQKLAGKQFEKIHITPDKLQIKPALNAEQQEQFEEKIKNIYKQIAKEKLKIASLDAHKVLPVENKLKEIAQQKEYYDKKLTEVKQKRLQTQKELESVIKNIESLENAPKTVQNQTKLTDLAKQKTTLQNKLNDLIKEENNLTEKGLQNDLKKVETIRKQKEALIDLEKETLRNLNKSDFFVNFIQNVNLVKTKIGLTDSLNDKKKVEEFLEWLDSKLKQKSKQLQNSNTGLIDGIFGLVGGGIGGAAGLIGTARGYQSQLDSINNFYSQKEDLIKANELTLQEQLKAGKIKEAEYQKQMNKLQENLEEAHQKKMQDIRMASFMKLLGYTRGFFSQSLNIMEQLHQAGYLKAKKWANVYKGLRVAQTIIDTYASAEKAMADPALPYPMNYAVAAMSIATGMARLAVIKAQKFHTGGYVDRKQFNNTSMGGLRDDEIPTILQKGEYVLSRKDVELIKQSVNPNVNVTANAPSPEVVIINDVNDERFAEYLQSRQGREIIKNIIH